MKTKHSMISQEEMLHIFDSLFIADSRIEDIGVVNVNDDIWALGVRAGGGRYSNVMYIEHNYGHFIVFDNKEVAACGIDTSHRHRRTALLSMKHCSYVLDESIAHALKLCVVKELLHIIDVFGELKIVVPCLSNEHDFIYVKSLEELLVTCDMQLRTSK